MVIDSSAIIAVLLDEAESAAIARCILGSSRRSMSTVSKLEMGLVSVGRGGVELERRLMRLCAEFDIDFTPFDEHQADIAREAFARFGKGRHPAGLNFGDCAAYALAIAEAEPLLFKGTDFAATDVEVVRLEG